MMIYMSCAKTMAARNRQEVPFTTTPYFEKEAHENALHMAQFSSEELARLLHINNKLAAENVLRYHEFLSPESLSLPALLAYTGIVFKRLNPKDFTHEDWLYAQQHLFITSFLYGLLRPLDLIKPYRLEGDVRLAEHGNRTMFEYWRPLLTDYFIAEIQKQGGLLINLASAEMKDLFQWKEVTQTVQVVTPEFMVYKNGKPTTIVVYAKMCRGEMTRFILKNRIEDVEALKSFEWEGFTFDEALSHNERMVFTLQ